MTHSVIDSKNIHIQSQVDDDPRVQAKAAFKRIRNTARENDVEMTLDEINNEISETRDERK